MTDIDQTDAVDDLFRPYLPRVVTTWGDEAGEATARELDGSLVSVDISGFTALSERLAERGRAGAEELILHISRCYAALIDTTLQHGGDVLKFRGDALLLLFRGTEHALRASRAALEMQDVLDEQGHASSSVGPVALGMAVGIQSGPIHLFLVGGTHRELIVAGPSASATLELEDLAERGEVLVSATTADALPGAALGGGRSGAVLLRRGADLGATTLHADVVAHAGAGDFLPPSLRAPIAAQAVEPEHRHATAAFVKFTGTDALVADLERAGECIARLGRVVGDAAETFGVTWLESDIDRNGGKLYLVAGAPASAGGDEERMLRALRAIVDSDVGIDVSAGVNRGPVFAGEIGSAERRTYAVMGDTVNVAARLTARAKPRQILAASSVVARSRARFAATPEPFLVKGKDGPIEAVWLGPLVDTRDDDATLLPLVGRDRELQALSEALDAARRREFRVVELVGEPGVGKSRLVQELLTRALGMQQLVSRCEQYEASTPFNALRPLLRPLVGIAPTHGPAEAGQILQPFIAAAMPDLAPWLPLLAIPFDASVAETEETNELGDAFRQSKLHEVLTQFLQRMFLMPTVFLFEDAHWMDDATTFFLQHLTHQAMPLPWLVCITRRPEGTQVAADESMYPLAPLDAEAAAELATLAAGEAGLGPDALADLAARSGGNALFVRELVAARAAGADELPETVETVITARIDRLDPADRQILRCASVIGARFDVDLLAELLDVDVGADRWSRIDEFVGWEDASHLRFRHDLFRMVSYEGLSYKRRRDLHRRVGEAIERRVVDADDDAAELLSLHFLHGGEYDKAWGYAVVAGDRARASYANVDAAEFYDRALAAALHLTPDEREMARVAEALGDVCELATRYERADSAYEHAQSLVTGDDVAAARLLRKRGVVCERTARYDDALRFYETGIEHATRAADDVALANLQLAVAGVRYRQGDPAACVEWAERAIPIAERADDRDARAHAYYLRGTARLQLGTHDTSDFESALPIYEEMGDVLGQGNVLNNLGIAAQFDGRWDEAVSFYSRSRDAHRRAGATAFLAGGTNNEGEVLLDQGRLDEAEALFREALAMWRGAGYVWGVGVGTANLGRVAAVAGRFDEAHRLLGDALAAFEEMGSTSFALDTRARIAECHIFEGKHRDALAVAESALEETLRGNEVTPRLPLLERLVGYALHQGRRSDEAEPRFRRSLQLAREQSSRYDEAAALHALAVTGLDPTCAAGAQTIFDDLGVVKLPRIPLP